MNIIEITTGSPEQTHELAWKIGTCLVSGTLLTLSGDLGSGKTAFVRGLARGLGVPEDCPVTSPTYTLINEYPGRIPLFHSDLYRLEGGADLEDIGLYDIFYGEGVVAIEWPDRLQPDALSDHLAICIEIVDDVSRKIRITPYGLDAENLITVIRRQLAADGLWDRLSG